LLTLSVPNRAKKRNKNIERKIKLSHDEMSANDLEVHIHIIDGEEEGPPRCH